MPIGRLIQKIARQPTACTSAPPSSGPIAIEMPITAPHMPIARARTRTSGNVLTMIDIATGLSIAPPRAWTIRNATSAPSLGAKLQSSEPSENTTRPIRNTRRRPYRSAIAPASIRKLAITTV